MTNRSLYCSKPQYHLSDATGAQVKQSYIIFDPRYANQNGTPDGDKLAELAKMQTKNHRIWQREEMTKWKKRMLGYLEKRITWEREVVLQEWSREPRRVAFPQGMTANIAEECQELDVKDAAKKIFAVKYSSHAS